MSVTEKTYKNLSRNSLLAFSTSIILWLLTIIDKIWLKGFINYYIHTPITYICIFFLLFYSLNKDWDFLKQIYFRIKRSLNKRNLITGIILILIVGITILFKNKLNEYLIHQNLLHLPYWGIQILLNIQFLLKSLILYIGEIMVSLFAVFLLKQKIPSRKEEKKENKKTFWVVFIILLGIFIATKLFFVFRYSGNFQDDWYHIVAGLNFFKDGTILKVNQYFDGTGYMRGVYMSVLTNFFMLIFGKTVDVAQLAPAFVGAINFALLLLLAKYVLKKDIYVIVFALLYMSNPFVIFNQLFIRFYVFYETFIIVILLGCAVFYTALRRKKILASVLSGFGLIIFNILLWIGTQDRSTIIFPIYTLLGMGYAVVSLSHVKSYLIMVGKQFLVHKWLRWIPLVVFIIAIIIFMKTFGTHLIISIFKSSTNDGSNRNSLIHLICYTFAPLVLLNFLSVTQINGKKFLVSLIIIFATFGLFLHLAMPSTYQVIRGFSYLWGLLYIVAIWFMHFLYERLSLLKINKFIITCIILVIPIAIIISNKKSYPSNFFDPGPSIVGEVAYYEFDDTFQYLKKELPQKTIVESSYNVVPDMFYDYPVTYVFNFNHTLDSAYFPTRIKQITSLDEFELLVKTNDVCVLKRNFSEDKLLGQEFLTYLVNNFSMNKETRGFEIWCER